MNKEYLKSRHIKQILTFFPAAEKWGGNDDGIPFYFDFILFDKTSSSFATRNFPANGGFQRRNEYFILCYQDENGNSRK